jgi:hypothetical protein
MCFPLVALPTCSFTPSAFRSTHSLRILKAFIAGFSDDVNGLSVCNLTLIDPLSSYIRQRFPLCEAQCRTQIDPPFYSLSCWFYLLSAFELKRLELFWKMNFDHTIGIQYNNLSSKALKFIFISFKTFNPIFGQCIVISDIRTTTTLVGARFFAHVQSGPGDHPASCTMGSRFFSGVKQPGSGADLPPLLAPRSRECTATPLPPPWAFESKTGYLYLYLNTTTTTTLTLTTTTTTSFLN